MSGASRPLPSEASLRIGITTSLPAVLRDLGVDPALVFEETAVSGALFEDPENIIAFSDLGRVLTACVRATKCQHVGLLVGERSSASSLGLVGFILKNCATVRESLDALIRHIHHHDRAAVTSLTVSGDLAIVTYAVQLPEVESLCQIYDGAVAAMYCILKDLCGPKWQATEVLIARRKPVDAAPYAHFFRAPVRFNAEVTSIAFPARWLDQNNPSADKALLRLLEERARELDEAERATFAQHVKRAMRPLVLGHRCSAASTAQLFQMQKRTLNRRLCEEGTDFRTLLDEVRYDISRQLLANTEISLAEIAAALDYSEPSAFTRAFRRWSGMAPRSWRDRHTAMDPADTKGDEAGPILLARPIAEERRKPQPGVGLAHISTR